MLKSGLIIVFTGKGKGKTTAAIGQALRATGQGLKVLMLQFIKGTWEYGELESIKRLDPDFNIKPLGKGFIRSKSKLNDNEALKILNNHGNKLKMRFFQINMIWSFWMKSIM